MKQAYLDTNVFVFATSDDNRIRRRASAAIKREAARFGAVTSFLTIDEYVWVAKRLHGLDGALQGAAEILSISGLEVLPIGATETRLALELMNEHRLTPHDAGHAAVAIRNGCRGILSFDKDFADIPGLEWIRP